jgi:hypothetical protein
LVQEKSELGVSAVAKLKEHHIMCVEELARNRSVRKIASTFGVDKVGAVQYLSHFRFRGSRPMKGYV